MNKEYEIKDHLGNVRVVFTDLKQVDKPLPGAPGDFRTDLYAVNNFYPFGMLQPKLSFQSEDYRFGFNGMLKDDEVMTALGGPYPVINGLLASYSTEYWQYDPLLGRWKSHDPLRNKYPSMSPYSGYGNNPIIFVDPDGRELTIGDSHEQTKKDLTNLADPSEQSRVSFNGNLLEFDNTGLSLDVLTLGGKNYDSGLALLNQLVYHPFEKVINIAIFATWQENQKQYQ